MYCLKRSFRLIKRDTNDNLEIFYIELFYLTTLMRYRKKALRIKFSYDMTCETLVSWLTLSKF